MILPRDRKAIRLLLEYSLDKELPGFAQGTLYAREPLDEEVAARLLELAGILSEGSPDDRTLAFEITARLLTVWGGVIPPGISAAADLLLAKLGNFPLRERLIAEGRLSPNPHYLILQLGIGGHKALNSVRVGGTATIVLTDEQRLIYEGLGTNDSFAFSAPTSGGKSFVLTLEITRLLQDRPTVIVYVVPTRALIRQVLLGIRSRLREAGVPVPVRAAPLPLTKEHASRGVVYVLTQERLVGLMQPENRPAIDCLIIDEAHSIGHEARGILLEEAIDQVRALNPLAKLFFGAPPIANPDFFTSRFGRGRSKAIRLRGSPVFQNLIHVQRAAESKGTLEFRVFHQNLDPILMRRELKTSPPASNKGIRAWFAQQITREHDTTIVYVNGSSEASGVAEELFRRLPEDAQLPRRLRELRTFLRSHVHPEYDLAKFVEKGIAVHHGKVPNMARVSIESLVEEGLFRFVVCTSTLLAGVNLPAHNIVIHRPTVGSEPISRADFRNLAGRAGRLRWEMYGNVWLLQSDSWWRADLADTQDSSVVSSYAEALRSRSGLLDEALKDDRRSDSEDFAGALLSKAYLDVVDGAKSLSAIAGPMNTENLDRYQETITSLKLSVPMEIVKKNVGLSPPRVNTLFERISAIEDLTDWIPSAIPASSTETAAFEARLDRILNLAYACLDPNDKRSTQRRAITTSQWLRSYPLRRIIEGYVAFVKAKNPAAKIPKLINDEIDYIEDEIRFKVVRNLRVYEDIVAHLLQARGDPRKPSPWHLYVECGTSDPVVLKLIALGFSRTSAIELRDTLILDPGVEPEEYLDQLRRAAMGANSWAPEVRLEVLQILGIDEAPGARRED